MKLVLYSGGDSDENIPLDLELLRLSGKRAPSITFIPTSLEESHEYFEEFITYFSPYGVKDYLMFPLDVEYSEQQLKKALRRDIVYLSGGNTFDLMWNLRESGAMKWVKEYVEHGGVLAGHSAGSIVMTPNIYTASFPEFDRDDNNIALKNFKAMNLTRFEFFPHFEHKTPYINELKDYSLKLNYPLYGVSDGAGVVIEHHKRLFIGDIWGFMGGKKYKV